MQNKVGCILCILKIVANKFILTAILWILYNRHTNLCICFQKYQRGLTRGGLYYSYIVCTVVSLRCTDSAKYYSGRRPYSEIDKTRNPAAVIWIASNATVRVGWCKTTVYRWPRTEDNPLLTIRSQISL